MKAVLPNYLTTGTKIMFFHKYHNYCVFMKEEAFLPAALLGWEGLTGVRIIFTFLTE